LFNLILFDGRLREGKKGGLKGRVVASIDFQAGQWEERKRGGGKRYLHLGVYYRRGGGEKYRNGLNIALGGWKQKRRRGGGGGGEDVTFLASIRTCATISPWGRINIETSSFRPWEEGGGRRKLSRRILHKSKERKKQIALPDNPSYRPFCQERKKGRGRRKHLLRNIITRKDCSLISAVFSKKRGKRERGRGEERAWNLSVCEKPQQK